MPLPAATVTATDNHPFWNIGEQTWLDAADLQPGDRLLTSTDQSASVATAGTHEAILTVHNLTIANLHTYYVIAGDTPVLVHNQGGEEPYVPSLRKLSDSQAKRYVGDIHEFKRDIIGRGAQISRYDVFIDTNNGNLYLNSKNGSAVNAIETGVNRNGAWVTPPSSGCR